MHLLLGFLYFLCVCVYPTHKRNTFETMMDVSIIQEAYNNLRKILANRWDLVVMQAEEQIKVGKDRKKLDKIITDSQEKAYWRVYRPPPGYTTVVESSPVPSREQRVKARNRTKVHLSEEVPMKNDNALCDTNEIHFLPSYMVIEPMVY